MKLRIRELFEHFSASLAQVFEAMAEQRPDVNCESVPEPVDDGEMLWWEQPLQFAPGMKIWTGAPRSTWEYAGTLTLKAAGLDTVEESEARNTWMEILGQGLSSLARAIGSEMGREVSCEGGSEHPPEPDAEDWIEIRMRFGAMELEPIYAAFSPLLLDAITSPPMTALPPRDETPLGPQEEGDPLPARSRTMGLLLDVDLPVSISFGKTHLPMRDVIKLTTGSIVELNRGVNEPVEVLVNGSLVARGEVVVVEGNYGVRILEIASRQDRMRSLR
jgi:flagellar motor switch protein FliN/FliY